MLAAAVGGAGIVLLTRDGDERSDEEKEYIDAVARFMRVEQADDLDFDAEESECFAEALVEVVGVESLRDVGTAQEIQAGTGEGNPINAIDIDQQQAETFYSNSSACIDYRQILLNRARLDGLSEDRVDCLSDTLSDLRVRNYFVASLVGDASELDDAGRAMADAAARCENPS